jgi:hypothetical protein
MAGYVMLCCYSQFKSFKETVVPSHLLSSRGQLLKGESSESTEYLTSSEDG